MRVGDIGSKRARHTRDGDAVSGSRLEGLTASLVGIIVGRLPTADKYIVSRELDRQVKGKDDPVDIFEPIGIDCRSTEVIARSICGTRAQAYRSHKWDK